MPGLSDVFCRCMSTWDLFFQTLAQMYKCFFSCLLFSSVSECDIECKIVKPEEIEKLNPFIRCDDLEVIFL